MDHTFILEGLDCAHCAEEIRSKSEKLPGVRAAEMNFMAKKLSVSFSGDDKKLTDDITSLVLSMEPDVIVKPANMKGGANKSDVKSVSGIFQQKRELAQIILAGILLVAGFLMPDTIFRTITLLSAYICVGSEVLLTAVRNISKGKVFDENFLMSIATVGAIILGDYREAVAVMLFYQVGEFFQSYAVNRSRRSISDLMDVRPDKAVVKRRGTLITVSPEDVAIGEVIQVLPGNKIPLDGRIVSGDSSLNTAALTGESLPQVVSVGDKVLSGCVNISGVLEVETEKVFEESTVAKILELVENAGSKKAKSEAFITRFAKYYTPAVVICAVLLAIVPPLIFGQPFSEWVYRAMTFLVISCPCALVISVPLSFFAGVGAAAREGVLVKGSSYLELLNKTDTVVFDKTGTLTTGTFTVTKLNTAPDVSESDLIHLAALAESHSTHPLAKAVIENYRSGGNYVEDDFEKEKSDLSITEKAGFGVIAQSSVFGKIYAGNSKLMEEQGVELSTEALSASTTIHVSRDGLYVGSVFLEDTPKPDAKEAIIALKSSGIKKTIMLTGDQAAVAKAVAERVGVDEYKAGLLPGDKVSALEEILSLKEQPDSVVAFVGDGINDAPVLARADIGIAMGALGSDAAVEAADIVLMTDQPSKIARAKQISKHTVNLVRQNIVFALGIKGLVLILGAMGYAGMWMAVFADVGVSVIAILNSLRPSGKQKG